MDEELRRTLEELNENLRLVSSNMAVLGGVTLQNSKSSKDSTEILKNLTEAEKARLDAQKKLKEAEEHQAKVSAEVSKASSQAKDGLKQFGGALLDSTVKLSNFGKGLGNVGDAAMTLGKTFGGMTLLLGLVTKGATALLQAQLKITESYLSAKDQLNQLGGAGTHTTESIREMARSADLNAETLGRMVKPLQSMGSHIMGLGTTAGEAQKNFATLIKATEEERKAMQRLGISQEEMMQGTADYLALQAGSGRQIRNELQDREKLRRASQDYQTQLLDLAALTGKDVKTLKEQQKEQLMNRQMQLKNMQDQLKANRLREAGDIKGAEALEREIKMRNDSMSALAGSPKALQDGIRELMTTGAISGKNAQALSMLGMQEAVQEYQKTVREGGDATVAAQKLQAEYVKKFGDRVESSGRSMIINEEIQNRYGQMTQEELGWMAQRMGITKEEAAANAQAQQKNREALMKAGPDAAADLQAVAQEGVIKATGTIEDVAMKMPILGTAAIAAAAALGTIVLAAKGAGGLGNLAKLAKGAGGLLRGGAAAAGTAAAGVGTAAAGAGTAAAGVGTAAAGAAAKGGMKGLLKGGARVLGKLAAPLAIGMTAYDAFQGFNADKDASFGEKMKNAGSSALSGLTFGLLGSSPEEIKARKEAEKLQKEGGGAAAGVPDKAAQEKMVEFGKLDVDTEKVKKNAEAFAAFSQAMSTYKPFDPTALEQIGKGVADLPLEQMKDFAKVEISEDGLKKIKNTSQAFVYFSQAMATYKPFDPDALKQLRNAKIADLPVAQMLKFAEVDIGEDGLKTVKTNAEAFTAFSNAMASYKGSGEDTSIMSSLGKGVASFFETEPPYKKLEDFAKIDIGGEEGLKTVKANAQAFVYFGQALSQYKGSSEVKNAADNLVGGLVKLVGGDDVIGKFVKFTKLDVDPDKALKLGQAFAAYMSALGMAGGGGGAAPAAAPAGGGGGAAPAAAPAGGGGGGGAPAAAPAGGGGAGASAPAGGGGGGGILARLGAALGIGGGDSGASGAKESGGGGAPGEPPKMATAKAGGAGGSMSDKDIKDMIKRHEGVRTRPYKDSLGLWTVGVGHLIGDGKTLPASWNREFSMEEVDALFDKDYEKHKREAASNVPNFGKYDSTGQAAFIDLTFNMGPGWPRKFKNTSKKIEAGDTEGAAAGLQDSLWYRQVASRGPTIVNMVRNAKVSASEGGIASGPETGYPATLHGNEMIVPLDPNSLLAELGKKSATEIQTQIEKKTSGLSGMDSGGIAELAGINKAMMDMMSSKLDAVINRLETSNSTQGKLLKYSKA